MYFLAAFGDKNDSKRAISVRATAEAVSLLPHWVNLLHARWKLPNRVNLRHHRVIGYSSG